MIHKVLMVLLILNGAVLKNVCDFPEYIVPDTLDGRFISTSTYVSSENPFYVERISFQDSYSTSVKNMYEFLLGYQVVPKIIGAFHDEKTKHCHFYFENVMTIDAKMHPNIPLIREAYKRLISALGKWEGLKVFSLRTNSFRYNPIENKYYFIDIFFLINSQQTETEKLNLTELNIETIFFNWIKNFKIVVQKSDDLDSIRENFNIDLEFYYQEYHRKYNIDLKEDNFKIDDNNFLSVDDSEVYKINIEIKKIDKNYEMTASLKDGKKRILKFKENKDLFLIYLCQKGNGNDINCMNLEENAKEPRLSWSYVVSPGQRIDLEVQDTISEFGSLKMKFYKVYLILTPENTPGVVPEDEFLLELKSNMDINDLYVICETNHQDLRVVSGPQEEFTFKTMKMIEKPLVNRTKRKIIQVAPSLFPEASKSCFGNNKKIFILEKDKTKNELLFIKSNQKFSVVYFYLVPQLPRLKQDMIYNCYETTTYSNLFSLLNPEVPTKKKEQINMYPHEMTLMKSYSNEEIVDEPCIEISFSIENYFINYELESKKKTELDSNYFYLNFNSYQEKHLSDLHKVTNAPAKELVYLTSSYRFEVIDLNFLKFEYPVFESNRIYISIIKKLGGKYSVNVIFLPTLKDLRKIKNSDGGDLILEKEPSAILDLTKDKVYEFSKTVKTIQLRTLTCNYRNSIEIVYSFDIVDFNECYPYLSINKKDLRFENIEINCSLWKKVKYGEIRGESLGDKEILPDGLKRVYSQMIKPNQLII